VAERGGWTGKLLVVDLTTGDITEEDTYRWVPGRIGAAGVGLALMWERVPFGTRALDAENMLYIGVGPLTGTWAPSAGRATAVSLSPAGHPVEDVGHSSMGGQWPAELKWAGFDGMAIFGRSSKPVFLAIRDGQTELIDAASIWGLDAFAAQKAMRDAIGDSRAKALVIGSAGEKLGRNAAMVHGTGHAFGQCGFGAVAGSKNLKGIIVRGTGRLVTATSLEDFLPRLKEIRRALSLMQSVVPTDTNDPDRRNSRWRARDGLQWQGGEEVIPIGAVPADDLSRQGLRHCGSDFYMNGMMYPWHVKNSGCTGCVMNCFSVVRGRGLPEGIPEYGEQHCVQSQTGNWGRWRDGQGIAWATPQTVFTVKQLGDMHGINSYDLGMLLRLLVQLRYGAEGSYLDNLDTRLKDEVLALPWQSLDQGGDGGLDFWLSMFRLMQDAQPDGDGLGYWLLQGTPRAAERFGMMEDLWTGAKGQYQGFEGFAVSYCAHGQRSHYGPDGYGLATGMHWAIWNRDPNRHEYNGLVSWSGLSWEQKKKIAEIHFGDPDLLDDPNDPWNPGPLTEARAELARFLMVRSMLKDSLTLCDWIFPNYCSPDRDRNYAGDLGLEAELYREVTGDQVSADELDKRAEAIVDLYRAITVRNWETADLRGGLGYPDGDYRGHDNLAAWYFEPFDGVSHLDRERFEEAKTRFYQHVGWDPQTGGVTRAKLESLDQGPVADELETLGLLPGS
jgi:aldehyde:ferredoxin oxidoreductase